jgi:hypothetical protein
MVALSRNHRCTGNANVSSVLFLFTDDFRTSVCRRQKYNVFRSSHTVPDVRVRLKRKKKKVEIFSNDFHESLQYWISRKSVQREQSRYTRTDGQPGRHDEVNESFSRLVRTSLKNNSSTEFENYDSLVWVWFFFFYIIQSFVPPQNI